MKKLSWKNMSRPRPVKRILSFDDDQDGGLVELYLARNFFWPLVISSSLNDSQEMSDDKRRDPTAVEAEPP